MDEHNEAAGEAATMCPLLSLPMAFAFSDRIGTLIVAK
jgi:hypothetical protein